MNSLSETSNRPTLKKSATRNWKSGRVKFALIEVPNHPEKNYIILQKNLFGKPETQQQKFIFLEGDWEDLKRVIEGDGVSGGLGQSAGWKLHSISDEQLRQLITSKPDLLEAILTTPNLGNFSSVSLEALDRLGARIFEIKRENLETILKSLADSSSQSISHFSNLLGDLRLVQVSHLSTLVYQKLRIIDLLESVSTDSSKNESAVHEIFEQNPWLLGKNFEIVQSDKPLSQYLEQHIKVDPETKKRPDLIIKRVPNSEEVVLVELKAPGIKLTAENIGQVLKYKALITNHRPNVKDIHCFLYGYEKATTFTDSKDVEIRTFGELIASLRDEYQEYSSVLKIGEEEMLPELEEHKPEPTRPRFHPDLPF